MTGTELIYNALGQPDYDAYCNAEKIAMLEKRRDNIRDKLAEKPDDPGLLKKIASYEKNIGAAKSATQKRAKTATCCLCGVNPGDIRYTDVFSSGFTNYDLVRIPGDTVCVYCAVAVKTVRLRQSSWVVTPQGITYLSRADIADKLFSEHATPFMFYVTNTYKKLGQIKTRLNYSNSEFRVRFEETPILFSPAAWSDAFAIMTEMYSIPADEVEKKQPKSFFTKEEIRTGQYSYHRIRNYGLEKWRKHDAMLREYRQHPAFGMLIFALNQVSLGKEKYNNGKKAEIDAPRPGNDGARPDLSSLAIDKLGQCQWW